MPLPQHRKLTFCINAVLDLFQSFVLSLDRLSLGITIPRSIDLYIACKANMKQAGPTLFACDLCVTHRKLLFFIDLDYVYHIVKKSWEFVKIINEIEYV